MMRAPIHTGIMGRATFRAPAAHARPPAFSRYRVILWIIVIAFSVAVHGTVRGDLDIPYGFELVEIDHAVAPGLVFAPALNNCAELVWTKQGADADGDREIMLMDNGLLHQLTTNSVEDSFAKINDWGFVTWTQKIGPSDLTDRRILLWDRSVVYVLGSGQQSSINNAGHIGWSLLHPETCVFEASVLYHDGTSTTIITHDERSNQSVALNELNALTWTSYDFCPTPWQSQIKLDADGETVTLPSALAQVQAVALNDIGTLVWSGVWFDSSAIELWSQGSTTFFREGWWPKINNRGDIAFNFRDDPFNFDDIWLSRDDHVYRLTQGEQAVKATGDINDYGELVISWVTPFLEESGIRMLRRVRNGDLDLDQDVDLSDFAQFPACATGPGAFDRLCDCRFHDMQHDRDVDLADFALFQNAFSPP